MPECKTLTFFETAIGSNKVEVCRVTRVGTFMILASPLISNISLNL
jgi:hypothetical protein